MYMTRSGLDAAELELRCYDSAVMSAHWGWAARLRNSRRPRVDRFSRHPPSVPCSSELSKVFAVPRCLCFQLA